MHAVNLKRFYVSLLVLIRHPLSSVWHNFRQFSWHIPPQHLITFLKNVTWLF